MSIKIDAGEWHATMATGSQTAKQGLAAREKTAPTLSCSYVREIPTKKRNWRVSINLPPPFCRIRKSAAFSFA